MPLGATFFCQSREVRFLVFWHSFFHILFSNQKTRKLTRIYYTSLKSWLKNFSNENKYVEQNLNRTRDIWGQSWPCQIQKKLITFSLIFSLWNPYQESGGQQGISWCGVFLSWGIDCRIKNLKVKFALVTRGQKSEFLKYSGDNEEFLYEYLRRSPEFRFLSTEYPGNKGWMNHFFEF